MPSVFESVIRAEDLLHCQLELVNLTVSTSSAGVRQLGRTAPGPAFIVIRFPPQHIAEQVMPPGNGASFPRKCSLAGPSRVTFLVPDSLIPLDYRLDRILECVRVAELVPVADGGLATAIECPDRLLLMPRASVRLNHRTTPFTSDRTSVTEVWHTTFHEANFADPCRFKPIENPIDTPAAQRPFDTSLTKSNRDDILKHSQLTPDPHVITSSFLRLTSLGATVRLKSDWPFHPDVTLAGWEHQTELGRDEHVYVLEQGYLFPFGHRATIVTVTDRALISHGGIRAAELIQTKMLNIQEPERIYGGALAASYPGQGREMPFARVGIASGPKPIPSNDAPISLDVVLTDCAGHHIDCQATVFFVPADAATSTAALKDFSERYGGVSVVDLKRQRVVISDDGGGRRDTALNIESLKFGAIVEPQILGRLVPAFLPVMASAQARIPSLEQMVGTTASGTPEPRREATQIRFHDIYLRSGFGDGNPTEVFATFAAIPALSIPNERAGGLAAPQFPGIDGLSAKLGPVAGVAGFIAGQTLSPEALIGDTKLLGVVPLKNLIAAAIGDTIPVEASEIFDRVDMPGQAFLPRPVMTTVANASGAETRFVWKPRIVDGGLPEPLGRVQTGAMELVLKGRITKGPPGTAAFEVSGKLSHFELSVLGLLAVRFNSVTFMSQAERKVDVKLDVDGIDFRGDLSFVQSLQQALPSGGFGQMPDVRTLPDGVTVRYAITLPDIPLGLMAIQNVALSSTMSLPFVEGKPASVRFALSERSNPFQINVSIFGGTGFFAIEARTDKTLVVEAALEFGGVAAINFFVVSGGVYLLAGIYLSMNTKGGVTIEGHLRFGGYVDVLGLVSVSIEVFIALTYESARNVLSGTGRLTVGVKLLFFSESFTFEIHQEIAGFGSAPAPSGGTPFAAFDRVFAGVPAVSEVTAPQWQKYCRAFA